MPAPLQNGQNAIVREDVFPFRVDVVISEEAHRSNAIESEDDIRELETISAPNRHGVICRALGEAARQHLAAIGTDDEDSGTYTDKMIDLADHLFGESDVDAEEDVLGGFGDNEESLYVRSFMEKLKEKNPATYRAVHEFKCFGTDLLSLDYWLKGLISGYHARDPERKSKEAQKIVIDQLNMADLYLVLIEYSPDFPVFYVGANNDDIEECGSFLLSNVGSDARSLARRAHSLVMTYIEAIRDPKIIVESTWTELAKSIE